MNYELCYATGLRLRNGNFAHNEVAETSIHFQLT